MNRNFQEESDEQYSSASSFNSNKLDVVADYTTVYSAPQPLLPLPAPIDKESTRQNSDTIQTSNKTLPHPPIDLKILHRVYSNQSFSIVMLQRQKRGKIICDYILRKTMIEFIYHRFAGHAKLSDEILIKSICLFDHYFISRSPLELSYLEGKELIVAALVLIAKIENVRHLSIKAAAELSDLVESAIIENEKKLFELLSPTINRPSICCFIQANLETMNQEIYESIPNNDLKTLLYHLATYIFVLNILEHDMLYIAPDVFAYACIHVATLLLSFNKNFQHSFFKEQTVIEDYYLKIMCRALKEAQNQISPINIYYSNAERCCVYSVLENTSKTLIGQVLSRPI